MERIGERVNGERRLVAVEMTGSGRQHEVNGRMDGGYLQQVRGGVEAASALRCHHDRRGPVRPVDRHLLGGVVGDGAPQPRGTHPDERFGREIDVLLVLGAVFGDGVIADLGELDADLA